MRKSISFLKFSFALNVPYALGGLHKGAGSLQIEAQFCNEPRGSSANDPLGCLASNS